MGLRGEETLSDCIAYSLFQYPFQSQSSTLAPAVDSRPFVVWTISLPAARTRLLFSGRGMLKLSSPKIVGASGTHPIHERHIPVKRVPQLGEFFLSLRS